MEDENDGDAVGRVVQGAAVVFVGNILGMGLAFFTRIFAANALSESHYGQFVLGMTLVMILALVGNLGLYEGLARNLPQTDDQAGQFTAGLVLTVIASTSIAASIIVGAPWLSAFFLGAEFKNILVVFALSIPLYAVFRVGTGGLRGVEDATGRVILQNFVMRGSVFVGIGIAILLGASSFGVAIGWTLSLGFTAIVSVFLLTQRAELIKQIHAWRSALESHGRPLLHFSLPLMGAASIWQLLQETDTILLGVLVQSSDLGIYDASFTIAKLIMLFFWPVGFLFLPVFSNLESLGDKQEQQRLFQLATKWLATFTLPLFLVLVVYPASVIRLLFRESFVAGRTALVVVAIGFFIHVISGTNRQALIGLGHSNLIFRGTLLAFIINLGLNIILIPWFGFFGAGLSTALTFVLLNIVFGVQLYQKTGLHPLSSRLYRMITTSTIGFLMISAAVTSILSQIPQVLLPVITVLIFLPVHLVFVLYGSFLTKKDIEQLYFFEERSPVDLTPFIEWLENRIK